MERQACKLGGSLRRRSSRPDSRAGFKLDGLRLLRGVEFFQFRVVRPKRHIKAMTVSSE